MTINHDKYFAKMTLNWFYLLSSQCNGSGTNTEFLPDRHMRITAYFLPVIAKGFASELFMKQVLSGFKKANAFECS